MHPLLFLAFVLFVYGQLSTKLCRGNSVVRLPTNLQGTRRVRARMTWSPTGGTY